MSLSKRLYKASKFLSCALRHNPEDVNAPMDANGWVPVDWFAELQAPRVAMPAKMIAEIVETDLKGRFEFNQDRTAIRARQGHSVEVNAEQRQVSLENVPAVLYHGTSKLVLRSIWQDGLLPMGRQHVHMTEYLETACQTGMRKQGHLALLRIDVDRMRDSEFLGEFWLSGNNVWLAKSIPPEFIEELK